MVIVSVVVVVVAVGTTECITLTVNDGYILAGVRERWCKL